MEEKIPQNVIDALAVVRESGATNMLDRRAVFECVEITGDDEALDWLLENQDRFVEALIEMGRQVNINE